MEQLVLAQYSRVGTTVASNNALTGGPRRNLMSLDVQAGVVASKHQPHRNNPSRADCPSRGAPGI
eukprot:7609500-Alexandrium_andersonii.AAC.1